MSSSISFGDANSGFQAGYIHGSVHVEFHRKDLNDVLNTLPTASDAPFNACQRQHDLTCLPDTRVNLLRDIFSWSDRQDERCIFWLSGLAGTGKSTIARTVARKYSDRKRLGASFFFSRGGADVGHAGKFVTSIAWQLASSVPSLNQYVCDAIKEYSGIANQSLRDQWQQLILRPLSKLSGSGGQISYMLVVDALDECNNDKDIRIIVDLLAKAQSLKTARLRIFLTSRPEIPIRHGIGQMPDEGHRDFLLHNISPSIVDHDLSVFFKDNLKIIREEYYLDTWWPGDQIMMQLIQNAGGLFIWAATACRFIGEGKRFAAKRLTTILQGSSSGPTAPEKHLDEIYTTVLKQSVAPEYTDEEKEEVFDMLRITLGSLITLLSPLSASSLSRLLGIQTEVLNRTLNDLYSVLDVPNDQNQPLRLHHPSFRDYLFSQDRCQDPNFWVNEDESHQVLADRCIRLMTISLKHDVCDLDAPGILVADMERSQIEHRIPPHVQYACLCWTQHLEKSGSQLYDNCQVHCFLQEHLLHWLEALGWIQKVHQAIHAVVTLKAVSSTHNCPQLSEFIHDIERFVLYNRQAIEQAPLQVYHSALLFAPTTSLIRRQFKNYISQWVHQLPEVGKKWNPMIQTLEGHSGFVTDVAFSKDGKLLASSSYDATIKLWDSVSGAMLMTLEGHSKSVSAIAFSPDGKLLASASGDTTIKLWDASLGTVLQTLGHSGYLSDLAFSPDGKLLASAFEKMVMLWNASSGAALQTFEGYSGHFYTVAFSPDGTLLASGSSDGTVKLWHVGSGEALQPLVEHSGHVNAVTFSPDGKLLASASNDCTVKLWDVKSWTTPRTLEGHTDAVKTVAISPSGKLLVSASDNGTIILWNAESAAVLQTLKGFSRSIHGVAFSPDGKLLASASGVVKLWDVESMAVPHTFEGHSGSIHAVISSPDGNLLVSASEDWTIKLWDIGSGAVLKTLVGHGAPVWSVAFSPDGNLLASASQDCNVKLWDTGSWTLLKTFESHSDSVDSVTFSPDSKLLVSTSLEDEMVILWDTCSGALLHTLEYYSVSEERDLCADVVAFSPDGKLLVSASAYHSTVMLWDTDSGDPLQTLESHSRPVRALAFSPDGTQLASASEDQSIKLWDLGSGELIRTLEGHLWYVHGIAFSPDGKLLASASSDKTVKLWDVGQGVVLDTLEVQTTIEKLSFSSDMSCLETNKGLLFSAFLTNHASSSPTSVFITDRWVRRGMEDIIWLPYDRRPSHVAVHGNLVALCNDSGQLLLMEFAN